MATAFIFPGQGAQSVGMLNDWVEFDSVAGVMQEASDALGFDLIDLINQDPNGQLNQTEYAQPALLAASVALYREWLSRGGESPDLMAGHSLGEYSALVASGAISLADGVQLVHKRGQIMQAAIPAGVGAMAAVLGMSADDLEQALEEARQGQVVEAVNFNAPGQIVIAGHKEAIGRSVEICKEKGASKVVPLAVSVPSHSSLMKEASEELRAVLDSVSIKMPAMPLCHNVNAKMASSEDEVRNALVDQLWQPVLWVDCYETLINSGMDQAVECGPGKVLSGLSRRIQRRLPIANLSTPDAMQKALGE